MQTFHPVQDASAWRRSSFSSLSDLIVDLGQEELDAIDLAINRIRDDGITIEQTTRDHFARPALQRTMSAIAREIDHGRGLVILGGLPCDRYDADTMAQIFWGLGRHLGTPVSQSVMGDKVGHVTDASANDPNVRGYRNRYESIPHTDYQDIVGFLCVRPGAIGGMSWFCSATAIHNELLETRPDLLEVLYRGFYHHRFGEEGPGEQPITEYRIPTLSTKDGHVSCKWIPRYIEMAELDTHPMTDLEREAFDAFKALSMREDLGVGLMLKSGQAAIMNNYTVLHGRTAFEDAPTGEGKRHLVRLWLAANNKRPVLPEVALYASEREGLGVTPRPGAIPSFTHTVRYEGEIADANL